MDSNTHQIYDQNCQPNSGLLRFRSAPSALIANFTQNGVVDTTGGFGTDRLISPNLRDFEVKSPAVVAEVAAAYPATSQHQSFAGLPPHYPHPNGAVSSSAMDGAYQFLGMSNHAKPLDSNLVRQNSSPAGMFTNLSGQNGYGSIKSMRSFNPDEELSPSSSGSKSHCTISSRTPSSLGMISQISDIESLGNPDFRYQYDLLYDPSSFMESIPIVKRELDSEGKLLSYSQNGEAGNRVQMLSHQLSLPNTSSEMAAAEKIFQINDSVPFKIRAKRGCATHPRSIAERVRRTKISERMRKLQELVPNMDKQMNTSDMLDLAVEYIRDLQGQFKMLSDNQAKCKCMNTEKKPNQNQMV